MTYLLLFTPTMAGRDFQNSLILTTTSDVTESMVTIRSPFCGYNMCGVKGRFKLHSIRRFMKMSV